MKKYSIILLFCILSLVFIGCAKKHECDWCGEEKMCKEKNFLGEPIYICDDCGEDFDYIEIEEYIDVYEELTPTEYWEDLKEKNEFDDNK